MSKSTVYTREMKGKPKPKGRSMLLVSLNFDIESKMFQEGFNTSTKFPTL